MSDNDAVLLEIDIGHTSFYAASIYLDCNKPIENNIKTLEKIIKLTKGAKLIIQGAAERTPRFGRGIASGGEHVIEQRCTCRFQCTPWRG